MASPRRTTPAGTRTCQRVKSGLGRITLPDGQAADEGRASAAKAESATGVSGTTEVVPSRVVASRAAALPDEPLPDVPDSDARPCAGVAPGSSECSRPEADEDARRSIFRAESVRADSSPALLFPLSKSRWRRRSSDLRSEASRYGKPRCFSSERL